MTFGNWEDQDGLVVKDVTDATFGRDVIEASRQTPVLVDFWAPWCGPCKALGPLLEQAVAATDGKVKLVKINVDENQVYAQQLRVQSIPAVFAFIDGQPFDGFMGALPPQRIAEFVNRLLGATDPVTRSIEDALESAEEMLEHGNPFDAIELFEQILMKDNQNGRALAGLVNSNLKAGSLEQARGLITMLPDEVRADSNVAAAIARVDVAEEAAKASGALDELQAAIDANPDNHQARFDLSLSLVAAGRNEEAVEQLLEIFRRDREWNDGAAKIQLFKLFDSFGAKDPVTLKGRRRLSSMIFT